MNAELLAKADPLVREEYERLRDLNGVLERALELATDAYRNGTAMEDLGGSVPALDDKLGWLDYWIRRGSVVYHLELV